jgi:plasmid stability protein
MTNRGPPVIADSPTTKNDKTDEMDRGNCEIIAVTHIAPVTENVSIMLTGNPRSEATMATALVRDLDDVVYERLKARAAGNNRSLEAELREILLQASKQVDMATAHASAEVMRRRLEGRQHSDSGEVLGEERLR